MSTAADRACLRHQVALPTGMKLFAFAYNTRCSMPHGANSGDEMTLIQTLTQLCTCTADGLQGRVTRKPQACLGAGLVDAAGREGPEPELADSVGSLAG